MVSQRLLLSSIVDGNDSKMEPWASKMDPRASNMGSKWFQIDPKSVRRFGGPQTPPERQADHRGAAPEGPGRPKWSPMGPKTSQKPPKMTPNRTKIRPKIRRPLGRSVRSFQGKVYLAPYPPSAGHLSGPSGRRLGKTTSKTHTLTTFLAGACKKHVPKQGPPKSRRAGNSLQMQASRF